MDNLNKTFTVRFTGELMEGHMIIIASTRRKAFNLAKKKIKEIGLEKENSDFKISNVQIVDTNISEAVVLTNGDY